MKIWLLDTGDWSHHGQVVETILNAISPNTIIERIKYPEDLYISDIIESLHYVNTVAEKNDIILITWTVPKTDELDNLILHLSKKFRIICSAGNSKQHVQNFSPANLDTDIEVIHCLNKKGELATFSNFGANTIGMYGTNINVLEGKKSGTTIAAALYAAIVSRNPSVKFVRRIKKLMEKKFKKEIYEPT